MDGVSAAATLVQLVQVAGQASLAIYRYAITVQKADNSRVQLLEEVQSFERLSSAVLTVAQMGTPSATSTSHTPVDFSCLMAPDGPLKISLKVMTELLGSLKTKGGGKMKRAEKLIWPFREKDITEMVSVLRRCKADINIFLSGESLKYVQQVGRVVDESEQRHARVEHIASKILREQEIQKQELANAAKVAAEEGAVVAWLKPFDCTNKHDATRKLRQDKTCRWLFFEKVFLDWRYSASGNILWLDGKRALSPFESSWT
ncbi:hypothetical protein BU15DRAFT_83942 [Melanogaster broomeanus]|nr:hypothetical protein BU15DRAFT_83942 [Melanogaster broomeanus]